MRLRPPEPRATPIPQTPEPLDEDTDQDEAPPSTWRWLKSNFSDECVDPVIVDDLFCTQVDIGAMTANGPFLTVPTALSASGMDDRAAVICDQIAIAHFDGATGDPLRLRNHRDTRPEWRNGRGVQDPRVMAQLAGMSKYWASASAMLPRSGGWEIRGVVQGPRQANLTIHGATWMAWGAATVTWLQSAPDDSSITPWMISMRSAPAWLTSPSWSALTRVRESCRGNHHSIPRSAGPRTSSAQCFAVRRGRESRRHCRLTRSFLRRLGIWQIGHQHGADNRRRNVGRRMQYWPRCPRSNRLGLLVAEELRLALRRRNGRTRRIGGRSLAGKPVSTDDHAGS